MTDLFKVRRYVGTLYEREDWAALEEFDRKVGSAFEYIPDATFTLQNKHQGTALAFTNACVVNIPANLRSDFSMGWMQAGTGQITFAPADGLTLNSQGGFRKSNGQWAIGGLSGMPPAAFLVYGALA